MSTGYLAALGTLFAWTISAFVFEKLSRLVDPKIVNKAVLFFATFLLGMVVCIIDGMKPSELLTVPSSSNWLWLGISGILGKSVGDYCGYSAMRILGARRRTMIATLTPGFIVLFGFVILNETMNWLGIIAMVITLISILILINNTAEKEEVRKENFGLPITGLLLGLAGAALTGVAFVLAKKTIIEPCNRISGFHATWIRVIVAFLALGLFDFVSNKQTDFIRRFIFNRRKAVLLFLGILFGTILGLSFSLIAMANMNTALADTIFSLVPIGVIVTSVIVYKKKINVQNWFYSILAVAGVILMAWSKTLIKYFAAI